jgi:hypothetical protein
MDAQFMKILIHVKIYTVSFEFLLQLNVLQANIQILVWPPALSVHATFTSLNLARQPAPNALLICALLDREQLGVKNASLFSVPTMPVSMEDSVCPWVGI